MPSTGWHFHIPAEGPGGYSISLLALGRSFALRLGGLEAELDDFDTALRYVRQALTSTFRLRVQHFGRLPYHWSWQEVDRAGGTRNVLESGAVVLLARLRRPHVVDLCNRASDPDLLLRAAISRANAMWPAQYAAY